MYAIRSYYANYTSFVGMDFGRCARGGTYTSPLFNRVDYSEDTEYENGFVKKRYTGVVITSYSIHYTKLYEEQDMKFFLRRQEIRKAKE